MNQRQILIVLNRILNRHKYDGKRNYNMITTVQLFIDVFPSMFIVLSPPLNPRWVQHHANAPAHGLGREVLAELGPHRAAVAVRPCDLAPDDAQVTRLVVSGTRRLLLGAVHIAAALAQVELRLFLQLNTVDAQKGRVLVLVAQTTLESSEDCLHVQPSCLLRLGGFDSLRRFAHFLVLTKTR